MIINPVPMQDIWAWRSDVEPMLKRVEYWLGGRMNADDILFLCEQDRMLLWTIHDLEDNLVAVIVTQVSDYPRARVISFVACAGKDMKKWLRPAIVIIRDYAKKRECTLWEIWARRGWKRVLPGLAGVNPRELLVVLDGEV